MASSSSLSSRNWSYDVFKSFSGEDVRKNFHNHFLEDLERKWIIAFKDNEKERSELIATELVQAIRDSRVVVVVLSNTFTSSSWCLNELLEIMQCKRDLGQLVIPVFYGLDTSHLKKQSGDFGEAFKKTCHNQTEEVKNQWKQALTDVANILGYHWDNDVKMVEEMAIDVLGKLNLSPSQDWDDFVGIKDHIQEMNSLLNLDSEEVRRVGIWGPFGIGKTTIARSLFSLISSQFQSSNFIDKGFVSKSMEIYSRSNPDDYKVNSRLQKSFLSEILGNKHQKVLIVIDDLDDQLVLDALAVQTQWFGNGSIIIVVTHDKSLLWSHGIDHIYEVCLPSEELALKIFCQSTFGQDYPPECFRELAFEVVSCAYHLPFGLQYFGWYLRGRGKEKWIDMMSKLHMCLDEIIKRTRRFHYDVLLNEKHKLIFRYIACLLNFEKVRDIGGLIADSDLGVKTGLKILVDKSLLRAREDTIEMQCLLQEMGKDIVRAQSNEAREREFLVDTKDICHVLEDNNATTKLLGISLDMYEIDELHIHESAFKGLCNLSFLIFYTNHKKEVRWHVPKEFAYFPYRLRLLRWDNCPLRCMPSKFCPSNLVKLQMLGSKLQKLWEGVQVSFM
ncbi:PREDICTED: disease resistance protein RPS6-like [Brassica oleracea var. oleracea]|uniref:disease resistance protein RPS6-like n=1 Tax=Brassica oleracea var. oleracea TaxID=109376 RepID=UPI0006A6EB24|nr:PREDICTED: disease resistance protein RPS6-like [Brassica oleracea var. oleracea]